MHAAKHTAVLICSTAVHVRLADRWHHVVMMFFKYRTGTKSSRIIVLLVPLLDAIQFIEACGIMGF